MNDLQQQAEHFLAIAQGHSEYRSGRSIEVTEQQATLELDLNVELPLAMKVDGVSPNGVRACETATVILESDYPWSSPTFYLRPDFPRDLPHLQPDPADFPPRPCLVDGDQQEYFLQFGLVEAGVWHLIQQLVLWLQRAATQSLMDPEQGWEPTLRRGLASEVILDGEYHRSLVDIKGGKQVFKARFFRLGSAQATFPEQAHALLYLSQDPTPLPRGGGALLNSAPSGEGTVGNTIACLIWPEKWPDGQPFIAEHYMAENVNTLGKLRGRAHELGCGRLLEEFFKSLQRCFRDSVLEPPVPVAVILCARRPYSLIGSSSNLELLSYLVELRLEQNRASLFAAGDDEPVAPALLLEEATPDLLRQVSGAPQVGTVALLGCGSVGSKMAMHLARSGAEITLLSDRGGLRPHNLARHALVRPPLTRGKAQAMAEELSGLGQNPEIHEGELVAALGNPKKEQVLLPKRAAFAINTTASLGVREALSALPAKPDQPRLAEAALFGRGQGAFLLMEGPGRNPTLNDLTTELYATASQERLRQLLFDPDHGLSEVQIGQGCGSLTMPMTDARLSAMTAQLTEYLMGLMQDVRDEGQVIVGTTADDSQDTTWSCQSVPAFTEIPVEPAMDWTLRVSQRVLDSVRREIAEYPTVETGGILIGTSSARLKAITVVGTLPAPADSIRTANRFTLGMQGVQKLVMSRYETSGRTLFDVGTWHSHLAEEGSSQQDRETARALSAERPPPAVLLIATPQSYYAVMHEA